MGKRFLLSFVSYLLCVINSSAGSTSRKFQYDFSGNLIELSNTDDTNIQYEYDSANRLVKVIDFNANTFQYQYDANNNCIRMEDGDGVIEYSYDLLNRLVAVIYPGIAPVHYAYDIRGRLQRIIYPGGIAVTYAYDASDRLTSVNSPYGQVQYIYDHATNTIAKVILPNGITTEYGYDKAKRVTSVFHRRDDKTLIIGFRYSFDGNGNRVRTERIEKKNSTLIDYSYDKLNRLISVKYPDGDEKFTYDELGNRLTRETPEGLIEYEYDSNNQLIKAGNVHYFYSARGNLIKKVAPHKTAMYTYDAHDNLVKYQDEEYEILYNYDGEGRRISKFVNGEKTFYINDVHSSVTQVLIEATADKQIKACYIYGLSRLSQIIPQGSQFYLYDYPDRNVIALADHKLHLSNHYTYEAFGCLREVDSSFPNHFTYAGEAYEEETGLIFLRNRYYDPEIGRFISTDPSLGKLINPQSFNPYVYVGNNPINFIDPLGLRSARACAFMAGTETDKGNSLMGHGFWVLTKDNGDVIVVGRYPGSPSLKYGLDKEYPGTISFEWPATDQQINEIIASAEKGRYWGIVGNCIDGLERGLKVLGVKHPSFSFLGISIPTKAVLWLESLNGRDDFKQALEQDLRFVADPDVFWPATKPNPTVIKPACPCDGNSLGDLGGVSFNNTAQLLGTLTDIVGAAYDSSTGQLILIGTHNYSLPSVDFDDLAVAVRSIYGLGGKRPQDPGISIDWNPNNNKAIEKQHYGHLHPMPVRYEGVTEGTRFGQVMFEADRLLKSLSIGMDNITGKTLKANVPGFASLPTRYSDSRIKVEPDLLNRMWFVPKEVILTKSADGKSIIFDRVEMEVLTESKRKNKQKGNAAVEDFAQHFATHFDDFSKQYPVLAELKRLGKITAIVKWIKENDIPLDLSLFSTYTPKGAPTPFTTPTTYFPCARGLQISFVVGGVAYHLSESNFHEVFGEEPSLLQESAINSRPSENIMEWDMDRSVGKELKAVAQTIERTRKVGNIRKTFVDMHFPISVESSLELTRYYNSFNERSSGFGKGWELIPASLHFPRKRGLIKWEEKNIVKEAFAEIFVLEEGREFCYRLQGLDVQCTALYQSEGKQIVLLEQGNGTFILRKENEELFFDNAGRLIRKVSKQGQSIEYDYNSGQLVAITHQSGKKIQLEYQNERIVCAIGPGGKKIYYQYDGNNQLYSVADQVGVVAFYGYDLEENLNVIYDAKKRPIFDAHYDNYHRAVTVTNGKTVWNKQYSLKDHAAQTQSPHHVEVSNQYDSSYRLLESKDSLGHNVEFLYQNGTIQPVLIKDNFGHEVKYDYDSKGNLCSVKNSQGIERRFWYDNVNRLVACLDGRGRAEIYFYDEKGRLKSFFPYSFVTSEDIVSNQTSFHYEGIEAVEYEFDDRTGAVVAIKKGNELAESFAYDMDGNLVEISDPYGYKIQRKYDERSRLISIEDVDGGFSYSYNERDQIVKISSPVGSCSYDFDEVGNLIWIKDANGNKTHLEYDENYNLVKIIDAEGGITHYEYNDFHCLTRIILPNKSSREIVYDSLNRPVQEVIGR